MSYDTECNSSFASECLHNNQQRSLYLFLYILRNHEYIARNVRTDLNTINYLSDFILFNFFSDAITSKLLAQLRTRVIFEKLNFIINISLRVRVLQLIVDLKFVARFLFFILYRDAMQQTFERQRLHCSRMLCVAAPFYYRFSLLPPTNRVFTITDKPLSYNFYPRPLLEPLYDYALPFPVYPHRDTRYGRA